MASEVDVLARAHGLFADPVREGLIAANELPTRRDAAGLPHAYRNVARTYRSDLTNATANDADFDAIVRRARRDHAEARLETGQVLAAARAEANVIPDSPLAQRELIRRKVIRLRAQRAYVLAAKSRAARRSAGLAALRYRLRKYRRDLPTAPNERAAMAVRAALSRLGSPYVWGATGPDRFDCSGLVQWAYDQAGVRLTRTTYDQIHEGIAIPRSQIRPGDLVFPHAGHVQIAIGNNQVVEAPHAGATVRVSALGANVAIRRPIP